LAWMHRCSRAICATLPTDEPHRLAWMCSSPMKRILSPGWARWSISKRRGTSLKPVWSSTKLAVLCLGTKGLYSFEVDEFASKRLSDLEWSALGVWGSPRSMRWTRVQRIESLCAFKKWWSVFSYPTIFKLDLGEKLWQLQKKRPQKRPQQKK